MKWFQLDSDAPNDPRIRAVIARFGNEGLGILTRLWCYIAAHGTRPGWSVDSRGRPIDKAVLVEATGTSEHKFDELLRECIRNGHVRKISWEKRGVIFIPAMSKRADTYTRNQLRTKFEHSSKNVSVQDKTIQDSTKRSKTPLPPFGKGGRPPTRAQLKFAKERRAKVYGGCPHDPRCESFEACVAALAREQKVQA